VLEWFKKFKSGDFDVRNEERGKLPKNFETANYKHCWMRMTLKFNNNSRINWMWHEKPSPFEIHEKDPEDGKIGSTWTEWKIAGKPKNHLRNATCQVQKKVIFRIVTGDEKWIYFENPKRKRSWVIPDEPSTSTARPNRYGRKTMLCVW